MYKRWFKRLGLVAGLFVGFASLGYLSGLSVLELVVDSDAPGRIQLFQATDREDFAATRSISRTVPAGRSRVWFFIDGVTATMRLRIAAAGPETRMTIQTVSLYSVWYSSAFEEQPQLLSGSGASVASVEWQPVLVRNQLLLPLFGILLALVLFKNKRPRFVCGFLALAIPVFYLFVEANQTWVDLQVKASQSGEIKLFWRDGNESFSRARARRVAIAPGQHDYPVPIAHIGNIEFLRVQATNAGSMQVNGFKLQEPGFQTQSNDLQALNQCLSGRIAPSCEQVIAIDKLADNRSLAQSVAGFLVFCLFMSALVFYGLVKPGLVRARLPRLLYFFWLVALFLVFMLAWQAAYNLHPDEHAHIEAIKYYMRYWDPPEVGDPRALSAYQYPWAISRLDDLGISYFLAGKFSVLLAVFLGDATFSFRAFNGLLFLLFLVLALDDKRFLLFVSPLLCTPQIAYLYAYANRGAFVLFVSVLLAWQLVGKKTALQGFLKAEKVLDNGRLVLYPGLLLGLLSIEQTNYYLFILFVFAFLAWRLWFFAADKRVFLGKCVLFAGVGLSVFIMRYSLDVAINGGNKWAQRVAYAEQHAGQGFKPSQASRQDSYVGLRLRDKGVSFAELFSPRWDWHKMSFKSFTGFYGYYAEYSPRWYYVAVFLLYILVLAVVLQHLWFCKEAVYRCFTILSLGAVSGGLLISLLFSWLYDFQPQGRYVFPILPVLLVYFAIMAPLWNRWQKTVIIACFFVLVLLSFYSFNNVALNYLVA